jgi:hypothetical protein
MQSDRLQKLCGDVEVSVTWSERKRRRGCRSTTSKCLIFATTLVVVGVICGSVGYYALRRTPKRSSAASSVQTTSNLTAVESADGECRDGFIEERHAPYLGLYLQGLNDLVDDSGQRRLEQAVWLGYNNVSEGCGDRYHRWMYSVKLVNQTLVQKLVFEDGSTPLETLFDGSPTLLAQFEMKISCKGCTEETAFASIYPKEYGPIADKNGNTSRDGHRRNRRMYVRYLQESTLGLSDLMLHSLDAGDILLSMESFARVALSDLTAIQQGTVTTTTSEGFVRTTSLQQTGTGNGSGEYIKPTFFRNKILSEASHKLNCRKKMNTGSTFGKSMHTEGVDRAGDDGHGNDGEVRNDDNDVDQGHGDFDYNYDCDDNDSGGPRADIEYDVDSVSCNLQLDFSTETFFPPCNPCGEGIMTMPEGELLNVNLKIPGLDEDWSKSCRCLSLIGSKGIVPETVCTTFQEFVTSSGECGCTKDRLDRPTVATIGAPTKFPTPAPTPLASPAARPTPTPTIPAADSFCKILTDPNAASGFPECNVCGHGYVMTVHDEELGEVTIGNVTDSISCGCADLAGQFGLLPACGFIQGIVSQKKACGCVSAAPTPFSTPNPTSTPSSTLAPTQPASSAPTSTIPAVDSTCPIVIDTKAVSTFPECNVCGYASVMTLLDVELGEVTVGDVTVSISCGCADLAGQLGLLPDCAFIQSVVSQRRICGCESIALSPLLSPTSATLPISTPTASPTTSNTSA